MAKKIYVGADGKARKVKRVYLGLDGKARKVKKVYIGVGGKARLAWASALEYSFTGQSSFSGSADGDWELTLKSSGTLTFASLPTTVDVFLCGGGGAGDSGSYDQWNGTYGGGGGEGGCTLTTNNIALAESSYSITIGAGGTAGDSNESARNGKATTAFGYSAAGGNRAVARSGGSGAGNGGDGGTGLNGGQSGSGSAGTAAFGGSYKYGGGGGAGAGATAGWVWGSRGAGGASGGANGGPGSSTGTAGSSAGANTGGGGGGGGGHGGGGTQPGGNGGSGIIIIRNHR